MGGAISRKKYDGATGEEAYVGDDVNIMEYQAELQATVRIPLEVQVAHFMPSSFPLLPVMTKETRLKCSEAWDKIVAARIVANDNDDLNQGGGISGMTVFYNEFYQRLDQFDSNGKFDAVLSRHSGGMNKIAAKGAILLRIIKFVLKIEPNSKQSQMMLYMLGKSHSHKGIRPWQYAVFVQVLLLTIASRLGHDATIDVMESWVNLFAYVMKSMLPPAIKGQVVETELNINTSSGFDANRVAMEVEELEEIVSQNDNSVKGGSSKGNRSARPSISSARNKPPSGWDATNPMMSSSRIAVDITSEFNKEGGAQT